MGWWQTCGRSSLGARSCDVERLAARSSDVTLCVRGCRAAEPCAELAKRGLGCVAVEIVWAARHVAVGSEPLQQSAGGACVDGDPVAKRGRGDRAFGEDLQRGQRAADAVAVIDAVRDLARAHMASLSVLITAVTASSPAMAARVAQKNSSPALFSVRCARPSRVR